MNAEILALARRVAQVRAVKQLSQKDFADALGISQSFLSAVERAKSSPGADVLVALARSFPDISRDWLLTGEGEMVRAPRASGTVSSLAGPTGPAGVAALQQRAETALASELGLGGLLLRGQATQNRLIWLVALRLMESGRAETLEEIGMAFNVSPEAAGSVVMALMDLGFVAESAGRYRATQGSLVEAADAGTAEGSAHSIEAIRLLVKTLGRRRASPRGRLATAVLKVPKGRGLTLVSSVCESVRLCCAEAVAGDGVGEESVALVLSVGVIEEYT